MAAGGAPKGSRRGRFADADEEENNDRQQLLLHWDSVPAGSSAVAVVEEYDDVEPVDLLLPSPSHCPSSSVSSQWLRAGVADAEAASAAVGGCSQLLPPSRQEQQLLPAELAEQDIPMLPLGRPASAGQQPQRQSGSAVNQQQQQQHSMVDQLLWPPPPLYTGSPSEAPEAEEQQPSQRHVASDGGCSLEPPPPYTASQPRFIRCKVCQVLIDIDNKQHLLVVRCTACHEVTPLREPQAGKRYLRCSCNFLMVVESTAVRAMCARPSCRRAITIQSMDGVRTAASRQRRTAAARCAHCNVAFRCNVGGKKLVRCPHCRKVSVTDHRFKMRMAGIFAFVGVVLLVGALAASGVAIDNDNGSWGMFGFLAASILLSLFFLQRTFFYCRLQVSHYCQPVGAGAQVP